MYELVVGNQTSILLGLVDMEMLTTIKYTLHGRVFLLKKIHVRQSIISNPVNSFLKCSGEAGPRQDLHIHNLNGFDINTFIFVHTF